MLRRKQVGLLEHVDGRDGTRSLVLRRQRGDLRSMMEKERELGGGGNECETKVVSVPRRVLGAPTRRY